MHKKVFLCIASLISLSIANAVLDEVTLSGLAASNGSFATRIVVLPLWITFNVTSFIKTLPIPVKIVRGVSSDIRREFDSSTFLKLRTKVELVPSEMLVFAPWYWNHTVEAQENLLVAAENFHVQLFIPYSTQEQTPVQLQPYLCQINMVSKKGFNVPVDRFHHCHVRKMVLASQLFTEEPYSTLGHKANKELVFVIPAAVYSKTYKKLEAGARANEASNIRPEVIALLDSYKTRNVSVAVRPANISMMAIIDKTADVLLLPYPTLFNYTSTFFVEAQHPPAQLCIFSLRGSAVRVSFLDSWTSFLWLVLVLAFFGALIVLLLWGRSRLQFERHRFLKSRVVLFMISTFLGRSPHYAARYESLNHAVLLASWAMGMLFLGNYIQTTIIAIQSVPIFSSGVRDLASLRIQVNEGKVKLCLTAYWKGPLAAPCTQGHCVAGNQLVIDALSNCGSKCGLYQLPSKCYETSSNGTYVTLSICTEDEIAAASMWNLVPGDWSGLVARISLIHKANPERHHHAWILSTIAQAGLVTPHRRRQYRPMDASTRKEGSSSVNLFFSLYLSGCALSLAALMCEIACHYRCRKH